MSQGSADAAPPGGAAVTIKAGLTILRFLVSDRLGIMALVWILVAFVLRPMLLAAHDGAAIPLLSGLAKDPVGLSRFTGLIQWLSLALPIVVVALAHIRLPAAARVGISPALRAFLIPAVYAVVLFTGYLAFVWTPTTYLSLITSEAFIFFDAAYRIANGEHPHIDFPTALGAATLYLPTWAACVAGGYAGSIELASAPLALVVGLVCAHAGMRRFPTGVTAAMVALSFLVVVPAVLLGLKYTDSHTFIDGQPIVLAENNTLAMFYNRWGWGVLIAVVCYLPPRASAAWEDEATMARARLIETLVLAALLTFLFYLKVTYFLVGCAAATIYAAVNEKPWGTLLIGVGATLALVLAIGLSTGLLLPYLSDLAFVARINAAKANTLVTIIRDNALFVLLAGAPLGLLALLGRFTWKDALIGGFLAIASIYVLIQNAQLFDIITLTSLSGYGLARVWPSDNRLARNCATFVFALTVFTPAIDRTLGLIDQIIGARREEIRDPAPWAVLPALRGFYVAERENGFDKLAAARTPQELLEAWNFTNRTRRKDTVRQGEYMASLMAGMADLKSVLRRGESVAAVDMANPFPFLMGVRAAKGSYLSLDDGRTFSLEIHPDPEKMFADADHVMIPRVSAIQRSVETANSLYAVWLTEHYRDRVETLYWTRWSHRKPALRPTTQMALIPAEIADYRTAAMAD
ncbi:MAG: hypothetical protein IPO30_21415 [Hyphomonadaceae bacterium]|nr:hypothetical protein [Hyphomonadaceae bacterium]